MKIKSSKKNSNRRGSGRYRKLSKKKSRKKSNRLGSGRQRKLSTKKSRKRKTTKRSKKISSKNDVKVIYLKNKNIKDYIKPIYSNKYATLFTISFGLEGYDFEDVDENKQKQVIKKLKYLLPYIKRGDIIEDTDISGYRSTGVNLVDIIDGKIQLMGVSTEADDYGHVEESFKGITEFPLDYWNYDKMNYIEIEGDSESNWHSSGLCTVSIETRSIINKITDKTLYVNNDNNIEMISFKYKNIIYYIYSTFYNNIILFQNKTDTETVLKTYCKSYDNTCFNYIFNNLDYVSSNASNVGYV